ncbi:MAG TPA: hypothetical protein VF627_14605 [Abditibacterium sp.]
MTLIVFCCKRCKTVLSSPLQCLGYTPDEPEYDVDAPSLPRVSQGFYFVEKGDFIVNLNDIYNTIALPDYGCCGRAGMDGRNTTCVNRHEVGTEQSDCYQSPAMILDGALVSPVPEAKIKKSRPK